MKKRYVALIFTTLYPVLVYVLEKGKEAALRLI